MSTTLRKWHFKHLRQQRNGRMSIVKCLRIIGFPPERFEADPNANVWRINARLRAQKRYGHTTFWERNQDCLEDIAREMKRLFHAHLKAIGHDFPENHEQSALLIEAYSKAKDLFRRHGVEV